MTNKNSIILTLVSLLIIIVVYKTTLFHAVENFVQFDRCPPCPSEDEILRKYNCLPPRYNNMLSDYRTWRYQLVGYLNKLDHHNKTDNNHNHEYRILPLYGKMYRSGGLFKYYTRFVSDGQLFTKMIFKHPNSSGADYSREIYDGDVVHIGNPIDAKYVFREERVYDRIDLVNMDPQWAF